MKIKEGAIRLANIKSAIKRIKTSNRNKRRNKSVKANLRTFIKKAEEIIKSKKEDALSFIKKAVSKIDRATAKGIIHKKTASRKKSRLFKKYNLAK